MSTVSETESYEHGLPGHGWTLPKLGRWLEQVMGCNLARSTLHRILTTQGLSWKKCQKALKKELEWLKKSRPLRLMRNGV